MINLDGTKQKTKLGANSILAVSMAVKKLIKIGAGNLQLKVSCQLKMQKKQ